MLMHIQHLQKSPTIDITMALKVTITLTECLDIFFKFGVAALAWDWTFSLKSYFSVWCFCPINRGKPILTEMLELKLQIPALDLIITD